MNIDAAVSQFSSGYAGESVGKTITEADVRYFYKLFQAGDGAAVDCKIVPELLVTMVAIGLMNRLGFLEKNLVAVMKNDWQYKEQVKAGETLKVSFDISEVLPTKKESRKIITYALKVKNQNSTIVADGKWKIMVEI